MSERAFKTDKEFEDKFVEYLNRCKVEKELPNIAGFSVFAEIDRDTFYAQQEYYSDTYKRVNDMLEDRTINSKDINDTFKIFYMKNKFGYKDKQESVSVNMSYEDYLKKVTDEDDY